MIFFGGVLGLLAIGVWIFCIIDAITTPRDEVRTLPKLAWVAIVVFLIDLGSIAWLVAGRPWNAKATTPRGAGSTGGGSSGGFGLSATSVRRAPSRPMSPDDDDEFLASLAKRTPPPSSPPSSPPPPAKPDDDEPGADGSVGTGKDDGPQPVG